MTTTTDTPTYSVTTREFDFAVVNNTTGEVETASVTRVRADSEARRLNLEASADRGWPVFADVEFD